MSGTLGGNAITRARVQVPAWGRPWVDVELAGEVAFAKGESPALVIADTPIAATVVAGGALHGRAAYRLVGGRGKWSDTIPAKGYVNDAGVRASLVLGDAAAACGELITGLPGTRLGPHFVRAAGPASDTLNLLAPRGWYVDFSGATWIGQRPPSAYTGTGPRTRVDTGGQIIELAVESIAGLVPGVVVDGLGPATDVEYVLEPTRLTARVWGGPATTSRRVAALQAILRADIAGIRYRGVYEFRVVTQSGERLNLQPVRAALGFPDLANVPVRPGVAGAKARVTPGELVLVAFVDADPSRPVVVAHDDAESPGWMPLGLDLGGPAALGVARVTDTVQAGPFAGAITLGSATIKAAP